MSVVSSLKSSLVTSLVSSISYSVLGYASQDVTVNKLSLTGYGQSNLHYWDLRGTPHAAKKFFERLREALGFSTAGTIREYQYVYNTGAPQNDIISVIHDGSNDIDATDYTLRWVNCAVGGSGWISSNSATETNPATSSSGYPNIWWNDADNTAVTGDPEDTIDTPGYLWRRARYAAERWPSQGAIHSHGGTEATPIGTNSAKRLAYKTKLSDFIDDMRTYNDSQLPYFIGHHAHHNRDADAGFQTIREIQTELTQEKTLVYIGAEEYSMRTAVGAYVSGCSTTSGSTTVLIPNTAQIGVNKLIQGDGIPEMAYVVSFVANTSMVLSQAATADHTADLTVGIVDDVHGYPGSSEPLDSNGGTTHDFDQGLYDYSHRFVRPIKTHFTVAGTDKREFGPKVIEITAVSQATTIDLTVEHDQGTTLTKQDGTPIDADCKIMFRVESNSVLQTITDVDLVDSYTVGVTNYSTIRLTMSQPIYDGTLSVWCPYGAMNRTNYKDYIVDNATPPLPMSAVGPVTDAAMSITVDPVTVSGAYDVNNTVVCEWTTSKLESYSGSGTTWANIAPPHAGQLQSAYNLIMISDPALIGTAGTPTAYFELDGGDAFTLIGNNTPFLANLPKTTGGQDFWALFYFYPGTTSNGRLFGLHSSTSAPGVSANVDTDIQMGQTGDTTQSNTGGSKNKLVTAASWNTAIIQHNGTTNVSTFRMNTNVGTDNAHTYDPCVNDSSGKLCIGSLASGSGFMPAGSRFYHVIFGTGTLSDEQAQALLTYVTTEHT